MIDHFFVEHFFRKRHFIFVENCTVYMTYYCKLSNKSICANSRYRHFKAITDKSHNESFIRFNILNPHFDANDAIMKTYITQHKQKNIEYDVRCVLNLLTTTNRVRFIRLNPKI